MNRRADRDVRELRVINMHARKVLEERDRNLSVLNGVLVVVVLGCALVLVAVVASWIGGW